MRRRASMVAALAILLASVVAAPAAAQEDDGSGGTTATTPGYVPPDPEAWIVVDADTGAVLDAHDERTPRLPASTIKLFTALVAVQRLPADEPIPISAYAEGMPARKINVKAGQVWDLEDLLYSMMLASANDAAVALAERIGGGSMAGWEQVAAATAARLGLADSPDLSDPAGLDDEFSYGEGSRISARDLAIVARAYLADPRLAAVSLAPEYRFQGGDGIAHSVTNHNRFLGLYQGAVGLKTGFTERAGRTFVGAAHRDGRTLIVVLLDAPDIYISAAQMLDRAFAGLAAGTATAEGEPLPPMVAGAALDPPERVVGALDPIVPGLAFPAVSSGIGWNNPQVAVVVLVLGVLPLAVVRRRITG